MQAAPFHQLPGDDTPPARAFWVRADDGTRLRLALWDEPTKTGNRNGGGGADHDTTALPADLGTVLLFPGRTEYVEKYAPFAQKLLAAGYQVLGIDWRGQGLSDRLQSDPRPGHIGNFADYQRDVVEMVVAATELDLPKPWYLLGHSMGGCIGLAALYNDLPVTAAAFSAPMWGINLRQMPQGMATGLAYIAGRLGRGGSAAPGTGGGGTYVLDTCFSRNLLTNDATEWARLVREADAWPDLTLGGASYDWVGQALNECTRLAALPAPDNIPMLVSLGSQEQIVSASAIRDRAGRWEGARLLEIEAARHEVLMDAPPRRDQFLTALLDLFNSTD